VEYETSDFIMIFLTRAP